MALLAARGRTVRPVEVILGGVVHARVVADEAAGVGLSRPRQMHARELGNNSSFLDGSRSVFLMLSVGCSSGRRPMRRRTWLTAFSVLALIAAAFGVANWLSRKGRVGPGGPPPAAAGPAQHRLERWKPGEELLALAGQKAVVLYYSGGDVDFWVEVESLRKRWKSGEGVARQQRTEKPAGPGQTVGNTHKVTFKIGHDQGDTQDPAVAGHPRRSRPGARPAVGPI